ILSCPLLRGPSVARVDGSVSSTGGILHQRRAEEKEQIATAPLKMQESSYQHVLMCYRSFACSATVHAIATSRPRTAESGTVQMFHVERLHRLFHVEHLS